MATGTQPKSLIWVGSSKKELMKLPSGVVDTFEYALYRAQIGERYEQTKVLRGFGDAGVLEVVESAERSTCRAIYTVRFFDAVYVLHVFQKKSRSGAATPKPNVDLIEERLKQAATISRTRKS